MATMSSFPARVPFGELGASQLRRLSDIKNKQNAIVNAMSNSKDTINTKLSPAKPSFKRTISLALEDDSDGNADSENIDPLKPSAKKIRSSNGHAISWLSAASIDVSHKSASVYDFSSNIIPTVNTSRSQTSPSGALIKTRHFTAPAGRSPKSKRVGVLSRGRNPIGSYRRIEPPKFGPSASDLDLSIDAALQGTLSSYRSPPPIQSETLKPLSVPKTWLFDIHEDTPDEEAANLMEHSTCILDLSSDEESALPLTKDARGKENVPPSDYVPGPRPALSRSASADETCLVDDGDKARTSDSRSPLTALDSKLLCGQDSALALVTVQEILGEEQAAIVAVTTAAMIEEPDADVAVYEDATKTEAP